jgi:hypothetical protein
MTLPITVATITLSSVSPYSQSRKHDLPKLKGEADAAYNERTWRDHLSVLNGSVVIPKFGLHSCITSAAKYSKRKIVGQGNATWTAKFAAGIVLFEDAVLNIDPATVDWIDINSHVTGIRGSGKRVTRRFPIMDNWATTFDIHVLDPIITQEIMTEMLEIAGLFVGIGRYRPENQGSNGRFQMTKIIWTAGAEPEEAEELIEEAA